MNQPDVLDRRLARLPRSVLHAVHRQVEQATRAGRDVLQLHVGEPAFGAPAAARAALVAAVADGRTGYTNAEGLPELRERLVRRLAEADGVATVADRVIVTPGSSYALAAIAMAVCEPGDEILLPEVFWPIYMQGAVVARATVRTYSLGAGYRIEADRIRAAVSPATRLVVVNSPANPTGALADPAELAEIARWARQQDVWLIGDEAYEQFVYDGHHTALASYERDVPDRERRVFSVHTFSKGYGMTGYRMGYAAAPNDVTAATLRRVCEGTVIAPSTPVQHAALAALDDEEMPKEAHAHVRAVRDAALTAAVDEGLLEHLPPAGWYAMVDVSGTGLTSAAFADRLLAEHAVAVAPGATFVAPEAPDPGRVRVAFCGDLDATVEGMRRLRQLTAELRTERNGA
ncbi:aspartate aminotransferase [Catenulispora sp. GP43]|uniref:pyridoxal phosphate-dependent aminotransferase n=1 Tax=Catenulispora sp. GP43 TaxID=3156263 RepID=UPI003516C4A1